MLILFELFGAVFLFIWCGNGVPTLLILALHPWISHNLNGASFFFSSQWRQSIIGCSFSQSIM